MKKIKAELELERKFSSAIDKSNKIIQTARVFNFNEIFLQSEEFLKLIERKKLEIEHKKKHFESVFVKIENLIQGKMFSNAIIELNNLIKEANSGNFERTLKKARQKLNECERLAIEKLKFCKELELKKRITMVDNLIQENKISEAEMELNIIRDIALEDNLEEIFNHIQEKLKFCKELELKKRITMVDNLIQENKISEAVKELKDIKNEAEEYNLNEIVKNAHDNFIKCDRHVIKRTVLDLGTKYGRLQIAEISEVCAIKDEGLITDTVKEMIENNEIYAQYFSSTKAVAFNQQANIEEIDKLIEKFDQWEQEGIGKKKL